MARYGAAAYRPLGKQTQPKMAKHDIVCLHTMVGGLAGTDRMFMENGYGGTESHFGVGHDGVIYQWQDTDYTADANYEGNHRVISIETADNAPKSPDDIVPWTPAQLDAIVDITVWACKIYGIPPVLVPDSKPGRRGIAYHRQGCEHSSGIGKVPGFLVAGGERWTKSLGKECPGKARIKQVPGIVARVKATLEAGTPAKETEKPVTDFRGLHKVTAADVKAYGDAITKGVGATISYDELVRFPPATQRLRRELTAQIGALTKAVGELAKLIKAGEAADITPEQFLTLVRQGAAEALAEAEPEDDNAPEADPPAPAV